MQFDKFVKKVKNRLGVEIHNIGKSKCWFEYKNRICSFYREEKWDKPGVYEARGFHMRCKNDVSDMMTDYFAGSFFDNGTQLLDYLKPPAGKFPIGTLVRGKDNKRATRQGYAGRLAMVMSSGKWMQLHWCEEGMHNGNYPERDFEKVA